MIYYLTFGDRHFGTHKFSFLLASFLLPVPGIQTDFLGRHMNYNVKINTGPFLAVQDSSISDIVCLSLGLSEPTNNQSLGSIKE